MNSEPSFKKSIDLKNIYKTVKYFLLWWYADVTVQPYF